jgi:hypothetical protein
MSSSGHYLEDTDRQLLGMKCWDCLTMLQRQLQAAVCPPAIPCKTQPVSGGVEEAGSTHTRLQRREAQQGLAGPVRRQAAVCFLLPRLCFLLRLCLFGVPPPGVELLCPRPQLADTAAHDTLFALQCSAHSTSHNKCLSAVLTRRYKVPTACVLDMAHECIAGLTITKSSAAAARGACFLAAWRLSPVACATCQHRSGSGNE